MNEAVQILLVVVLPVLLAVGGLLLVQRRGYPRRSAASTGIPGSRPSADSNRAHPGAGHIDFGRSFEALRDIDFDGHLVVECALRGDAKAVLPEVVRYLRSLMG